MLIFFRLIQAMAIRFPVKKHLPNNIKAGQHTLSGLQTADKVIKNNGLCRAGT